jgi:small-conductance mechanosensitive channel
MDYIYANSFITETSIRLIGSITILLLGLVIGRFLSKLTAKIVKEIELNRILKGTTPFNFPLEQIISSTVRYIVYFIALILALNQLNLTKTVFYLVLGAILVILITFIIISIKDFVPNIIAGIIINRKRSLKIGDKIEVDSTKGKILEINLVETKIETKDKDIIWIPNSLLIKNMTKYIKPK